MNESINFLIKLSKCFSQILVFLQHVYGQWNLNSFEFKFDDTRLSSWYKNKIGLIEKKNCYGLTLLSLCPVWLSQFSFSILRQPTAQRQSNVRMQQDLYLIKPILFLYYEVSLVSSNLNSKLSRFHCVRPNIAPAVF